ncbi:MAG: SurA N-terminal domain-containing protein [Spirochaetaceae bacterium]|jgi:hypothetical protein|nr:SurA N-terminal domain-containing protein [Spirochaetaceae bacterium]
MKKYLCLCVFSFLGGFFLFPQDDIQTVATVNLTKTEPILVKQLRTRVEAVEKATGRRLSTDERREILNGMIDEMLILQAAVRDRISVEEGTVNQQIEDLRTQLTQQAGRRPTDAEFAEAVKAQTGLDLSGFREQMKKLLVSQKYLMEKKGNILQAAKAPSDAEILSEYNQWKTSADGIARLTQEETIQFAAIVFPYEKDADKAKARNGAEALEKEIGGSVRQFDEKVQQQSTEYRATTAGVMQKNKKAQSEVGQAFMDAAFGLKYDPKTGATEVSKMIEVPTGTARGFYIIKITAKYPFKSPLALDDTMIQYSTTVRNVVRAALAQERQQDAIAKAQDELTKELRKNTPFKINEQYLDKF